MSDKLVVEIDSKDAEVAMRNLDRLTTAAEQMGRAFENTKGATSALRELRLMLTGIKGQSSSLDELKNSIQSLNSTADSLKRSFAGSVGQLGRIFKNEMTELKSIVQETGLGIGKAAADSLSDGIASPESRRKVVGAMRAQVAEMQAAYEQELAKGVKFSGRDLFDFKSWGLNIGADAKQAIRDGLVKDAAPIPVERILGLDRSQVVKSAKDSAAVFQEAYSVEMAQGRLLFKNFEQALGLDKSQVVKSAKDSAAVFREAYNAEMRSMQRSAMPVAKVSRIDAADATYASAMAQMKGYYKELESSTNSGVASAGKMSKAFKQLTIDGNDAHSMARGLASGFNLLWLTWGNMAPLLAGAAISNGFMQTVKIGLQVQDTFTTIAALGKENGETFEAMGARVAKLNDKLIELGNSSIYGPRELAEAMQTLTLAGLKADEVIAGLGPTLQLAMAGTTSVQTAADVLVSITTAFGTGAAGFQRAADVIVRAAADSKASVESIGNAMKLASVAGEQYGASLDDVGALIAALANVGIQGSAAGTAIRNMFADMSERTPKVAAAMKKVGLEFRDADGNMKPLIENTKALFNVLQQLEGKSGKNLLADIFSERGGKAAVAALVDYKTQIKDIQGNLVPWSEENNKLAQSLRNVADSAGDAFIASALKAESGLNSFKQAGAVLQTTMYTAFQAVEPQLYMLSVALREAFASPEVLNAITALAKGVTSITLFIAEHVKTIAVLVGIWGSVKLAGVGFALAMDGMKKAALAMLTVFPSMVGGTSAFAVAINELAVARNKEAVAALAAAEAEKRAGAAAAGSAVGNAARLGTFARLLGILPGIGTAVSLAATAWSIYDIFSRKSSEATKDYTDTHSGKLIEALGKEADKLETLNALRATGLTLAQAELALKERTQLSEAGADFDPALKRARDDLQKYQEQRKRILTGPDLATAHATGSLAPAAYSPKKEADLSSNLADITKAQAEVDRLTARKAEAQRRVQTEQERVRAASRRQLELDKKDAKEAADAQKAIMDELFGKGSKLYERAGEGAFGGPREFYEAQKTAFDKSIQEIEKRGKVEIEKLQSIAADKKAILDSEQQAGLLSTEEYNSQLMVLLKSSEDAQIAEIRKTSQKFRAEYDNRHRTISDLIAKAEATPAKGKEASAAKASNLKELRAELSTLEELATTSSEQWSASIDKLTSRYDKDLQVAINKNLGSLKKLREEDDKFWKDQTDELAKAKALNAVNQQYANINDSVFSLDEANKAYALAFADSFAKTEAYVVKLNTELETAKYAAEEFWHAAMADGEFSDTDSSGYISYLTKIQELEKLILEARKKGVTLAGDTGQAAFDRKRAEQSAKLASDLSDAVMTGLVEGGEQGKTKLRDVLVAELRKPIKMVVDLVMKTAVGSFMGGIGGAAQAGQGGAGGANILSTVQTGFSAINGSISSTIGNAFSKFATSSVGTSLGLSTPAVMGNNPSAYVAPQLSSVGSAIGTGLGMAGNALAGYGISSAISNGYTTGGNTVNVLSGIASAFFGPLAGVAGGLINRAFGRKLKDSGIQGTFGGQSGFEGESFEFYKGGWFRSDKTKTSPLDEEVRKTLGDTFGAMRAEVGTFATLLGLETDRLAGFTTSIKLSLKGLDDKAAQEKIQEALATANNELAQQVIGTWTNTTYTASEYAKEGEKAIDTLKRLATSLSTVNAIWENLGFTLYEASLRGADAASKMADAFGGLENLTAVTGVYYENFYSEAEKTANITRNVTKALAEVGLEMPKTREQFRALVESQMALGESGVKAVVTLMNVSGAFAEITPAADAAANSVDKLASALEHAFPSATTTIKNLVTELTNLSKLRNAAGNLKDKISRAMGGSEDFAKQREAELWTALAGTTDLEKQIELAQELSDIVIARQQKEVSVAESLLSFSKSLKDYVESLKLGDLSPLTSGQKLAEAGRQYAETLAKARSGDVGAQGKLESVASSYLTAARTYYASSSAYTDIFNNVTGALDTFSNSAATQAEQQLTTSNASLAELQKLYTTAEQLYVSVDSQYNAAVEQLKVEKDTLLAQLTTVEQLQALQQILSGLPIELQGLFSNLLGGYFDSLSDLLRTAQADTPTYMLNDLNKIALQSGASQDQFRNISTKLYTDVEVAEMITHGQRNYATYTTEQLQKLGTSQYGIASEQFYRVFNDLDSLLARVPTEGYTANLLNGSHAAGLSYVPFDGYIAELHKGERIVPARENTTYGNDSKELLAELAALRAAVEALQKSNREDTAAHISATIQAAEFSGQVVASAVAKTVQTAKVEEKARIR